MLWNVVLVEAKRRRKTETSGVGRSAWLEPCGLAWFGIDAAGEGIEEISVEKQ